MGLIIFGIACYCIYWSFKLEQNREKELKKMKESLVKLSNRQKEIDKQTIEHRRK